MKKPMATRNIKKKEIVYGGGLERFLATVIDTVLLAAASLGVLLLIYSGDQFVGEDVITGFEFLVNYFLPPVFVIMFWILKGASPGKMLFSLTIVNATTLNKAGCTQLFLRYFAYFVSMAPLLIGVIWIFFDQRKMAWHDKLTNTVVIKSNGVEKLK